MTIAAGLALAMVSMPSAARAESNCAEVDQAKKALSAKLSAPEPRAGMQGGRTTASARATQQDVQAPRQQQEVQAPRQQDVQAPRQQQEVQAPRTPQQDIQAPRTAQQDIQAPRGAQDGQTARTSPGAGSTPDLARAQTLIAEATQACTAGKKTEAAYKARQALALLR
jgi:hypothetical protein